MFVRNGGTIPVAGLFQDILGLPDDNIHGPNERLHLPMFFRGIETSKHFFEEAGNLKDLPNNHRLIRTPALQEIYS